jgi:hypothetical protein
MPQYSLSWWLSPVIRRALEKQFNDENDNEKQLGLLIARLSKPGCPNC